MSIFFAAQTNYNKPMEAEKNNAFETGGAQTRKRRELLVFLFLAVVLAPLVAFATVAGIGLFIWIAEIFGSAP